MSRLFIAEFFNMAMPSLSTLHM